MNEASGTYIVKGQKNTKGVCGESKEIMKADIELLSSFIVTKHVERSE